jgi:hypothetical protein
MTRAKTAIKNCIKRRDRFATRYRTAYQSLTKLSILLEKPAEWSFEFSNLADSDMTVPSANAVVGSGSVGLTWIWTCTGVNLDDPEVEKDGESMLCTPVHAHFTI